MMNKEEILEAIQDDKMMPFIQPEQLAGIVDFVIKNYRPSLPSNLDEAAEEWCKTNNKGVALSADKKSHYLAEGRDAFKAGAEWMAGQGWIGVDERLPEMDQEVIVLADEIGTAPIYKIGFGHIVDVERCIDYNGWNCPGVKYWMPCPEIPNND